MKLIVCPKCSDAVKMIPKQVRHCGCGVSSGVYAEDGVTAEVGGPALVMEIDNQRLVNAISAELGDRRDKIERNNGHDFRVEIVPWNDPSITRK